MLLVIIHPNALVAVAALPTAAERVRTLLEEEGASLVVPAPYAMVRLLLKASASVDR